MPRFAWKRHRQRVNRQFKEMAKAEHARWMTEVCAMQRRVNEERAAKEPQQGSLFDDIEAKAEKGSV